MVWVIIGLVILMVFACFVTYKETKHHELHKVRACFENRKHRVELSLEEERGKDDEAARIFMGEIIGLKEALEVIKEEDADGEIIQEIEDDLAKLKEKIAGLFKK